MEQWTLSQDLCEDLFSPITVGTKAIVEYFPGETYELHYININDDNLVKELKWVANENGNVRQERRIAIDLEWRPDFIRGQRNQASLYQFAHDKRILIIKYPEEEEEMNDTLNAFLLNHKFIGKGTSNDHIKLMMRFGDNFKQSIDDIDPLLKRMIGKSGFDFMIEKLAGKPSMNFKDKSVTFSDWNAEVLVKKQLLYAGFDVCGLLESYINLTKE